MAERAALTRTMMVRIHSWLPELRRISPEYVCRGGCVQTGSIGRARLAEMMGGSGTGKRKPPHKGAGKTTEQAFFAALHFWRGNMCLCAPGSILLTWDDPLPGHPRRRSLGSISAEQIAQCILSRSGRTCPCCQGADLQRGLWLDAGGLPPLPDHVGR